MIRRIFSLGLHFALVSWGGLLALGGSATPGEVRTIRIGVEVNSPPLSSALVDGVPVQGAVPVGFTPGIVA